MPQCNAWLIACGNPVNSITVMHMALNVSLTLTVVYVRNPLIILLLCNAMVKLLCVNFQDQSSIQRHSLETHLSIFIPSLVISINVCESFVDLYFDVCFTVVAVL